ncbi:MAG: anhydro-N-acetylmuramic acid kinase [Sphingobium sp.]|jgi:anhydro-N-acetylmuramic acid kinase|uniref:anhydro-N-acetylmuramic acid kinase n=1 Tax=Sphingobium sp. TaxID=1912891 RepID=UPI0011F89C9F|nr:anhydro-N-acetylmuramic acid kinase [Sphingobium sp.]MBU0657665.1 anhydro-N-acetylmuramic acid kinase [Alphaproteobacteria bacterium]MBA4754411.1 anhydro-N-acetylmuramic acid kinase [Sphingobium sp.]MBU0868451.1 anhydro-N-acetylmuramic acid kinase [Alphaproteobacteria bacterium]MBU1794107.1 anhydro-N-acetylmuramic acid kinase [Alphaproteobacteria bacterium]TAJ75015.1 MAG: anhydro-N-acetylmuramic acid kinase [Sphingobium sp.]
MLAIGLMSGTSRDGIDAALIETDGDGLVKPVAFHAQAYQDGFRVRLAEACARAMTMDAPGFEPLIASVEAELTELHVEAVADLLGRSGHVAEDVGVIGFHGHTVAHRPDRRWTWQIGDGAALAGAFGIAVVGDLRSADVAAGGQGAPLLPVYHRALAAGLEKPVAILNLGGVANITAIGSDGALTAFDTGMASGLIDNWMQAHGDLAYDAGGACAAQGRVDEARLGAMLADPWFAAPPPKSIDREAFTIEAVQGLDLEDGAATLTAFSAAAVARGIDHLAERPLCLHVAGGGRHNRTLMAMLAERCRVDVRSVDALGWDGDALEAQGFAYMAVRHLAGLPISFPGTTGAPAPMTGGVLFRA